MAKPATRIELLAETRAEREKLLTLLGSMTPAQLQASPGSGWSPKDIVAHLAEWERMLFGWYEAGRRGEKPAVPAEGYSWANLAQLNDRIYGQFRDRPLEAVLADWRTTSQQLIALAEKAPEDELFGKGRHAWTGRATLADYVRGCGADHYSWARREIRKSLKAASSS
jgi:uncharacterized protein (TIGR03083 family)